MSTGNTGAGAGAGRAGRRSVAHYTHEKHQQRLFGCPLALRQLNGWPRPRIENGSINGSINGSMDGSGSGPKRRRKAKAKAKAPVAQRERPHKKQQQQQQQQQQQPEKQQRSKKHDLDLDLATAGLRAPYAFTRHSAIASLILIAALIIMYTTRALPLVATQLGFATERERGEGTSTRTRTSTSTSTAGRSRSRSETSSDVETPGSSSTSALYQEAVELVAAAEAKYAKLSPERAAANARALELFEMAVEVDNHVPSMHILYLIFSGGYVGVDEGVLPCHANRTSATVRYDPLSSVVIHYDPLASVMICYHPLAALTFLSTTLHHLLDSSISSDREAAYGYLVQVNKSSNFTLKNIYEIK